MKRSNEQEAQFDIEFGRTDFEWVAAGNINVAKQVRDEIEAGDSLDELKTSMIVRSRDGESLPSEETELLNMISVAKLDLDHLMVFIEQLNIARSTNYSLTDFQPVSKKKGDKSPDTYYVLINGHRRLRSMTELGTERGYPTSRVGIFCQVFENVSYLEAARRQLNENTYVRPKPYEEARLVVDVYNMQRQRYGKSYDATTCANELSISRTRVKDALAYIGLPDEFKEMIHRGPAKGGITYGLGLLLSRVQEEAQEFYGAKETAGELEITKRLKNAQDYTVEEMRVCLGRVFNKMLDHGTIDPKRLRSFIAGHIHEFTGKPIEDIYKGYIGFELYVQDGFDMDGFELDMQESRKRVDIERRGVLSARQGGRVAVSALYMALLVHPEFLGELSIPKGDLAVLARAFDNAAGEGENRGAKRTRKARGGYQEVVAEEGAGGMIYVNPIKKPGGAKKR